MPQDDPSRKRRGRKERVEFRPNRQQPGRRKRWEVPDDSAGAEHDTAGRESVRARGELSRKRTVAERDDEDPSKNVGLKPGKAIAVRGQFVEVDDGVRIWPCTIRRILRTLLIEERSPVVVGDDVLFSIVAEGQGQLNEGVIEKVLPRRTVLKRSDGRKTHTIAANVDQALIVASIYEPMIKPHLLDRYLVAAHAGGMPAIIGINKIDLDPEDFYREYVERYTRLGYAAIGLSAVTGAGLDELREQMTGKVTLLAGQSGVGKSSLLNALQPGMDLKTAPVSETTEKGCHTTTTGVWLKLGDWGVAVDTPGIRALDVAMVPINELEMHFVEFVDRLAGCKYPNCVHIHEDGCAIKAALEAGEIDPSRYESYLEMFMERGDG